MYESKTTDPSDGPEDTYSDRLQFVPQEEGRIRYVPGNGFSTASQPKLAYDYFLKDHLGNVRAVITEGNSAATAKDRYKATYEPGADSVETALFGSQQGVEYARASVTIALNSCNMKVYTLLDNTTVVPRSMEVYENKFKFNPSILNLIDTAVVYEELNVEIKSLERLVNCSECHRKYLVYKFYANGCFNVFSFWKDSVMAVAKFNPDYSGVRGIYYLDKDEIRYDYFSAIDQRRNIGKIRGTLKINGDTLYVKRNDRKGLDVTSYQPRVFIKRRLPSEYFMYKANW